MKDSHNLLTSQQPPQPPRSSFRQRPSLGLALGLGLALCSLLGAQGEPDKDFEVKSEDGYISITVNEEDGIPLRDFIKLAQRFTGKVFTYSEQEIGPASNKANNIKFIGPMRVKEENFFAFFQTMLYIKDFACTVRGEGDTELVEIIFLKSAAGAQISSSATFVSSEDLPKYRNQTGVMILTTVSMEHLDANKATQQLRPFFAPGQAGGRGLTFGNVGNVSSILLQGFGPQVYSAYELLMLADVPADDIDLLIEPVSLEYEAAEELEPILTELLGTRRPVAASPQGAAAANQPMKILAQVSSNTLLLSGTRDQVNEAKNLIAVLDRPLEEKGSGNVSVIRLQNVRANDLRQVLNDFVNQDLQAEQQAQAGQAPNTRRPRKPVVVAHEESNKLLISAPATKFAEMRKIIAELDKRQRQVLVECAVVELVTADLKRFGIELGLLDIAEDSTRPFGFTTQGLTTFQDTDDDGLPDTRLPDFDNPLQGFTGGILNTGGDFSIPVILNALGSNDRSNVLSLPSVLVNNNESATVVSTEQRPTQTTNQGTSTTQSGFGGFEGAGITLNISPSISSNNYLRLNISLEVSRFLSAFDPNGVTPGPIATRTISTQVTMPGGHTMVLGGVIEDQESVSNSGVPFLKDIPILGWLFKTQATEDRKTNLYFFLTPHILDEEDFSDLAKISFERKLQAEEYIGRSRLQVVDPTWTGGTQPGMLEDPLSTMEDYDKAIGGEFPHYTRPPRTEENGVAPTRPGNNDDKDK